MTQNFNYAERSFSLEFDKDEPDLDILMHRDKPIQGTYNRVWYEQDKSYITLYYGRSLDPKDPKLCIWFEEQDDEKCFLEDDLLA